jgi:hypothetical protein
VNLARHDKRNGRLTFQHLGRKDLYLCNKKKPRMNRHGQSPSSIGFPLSNGVTMLKADVALGERLPNSDSVPSFASYGKESSEQWVVPEARDRKLTEP